MVNEQYERAKKILSDNKEGHNKLAQLLIDKEVIFAEDVEEIFGKRPWASRSEEIISASKTSRELKEAEEKEAVTKSQSVMKEVWDWVKTIVVAIVCAVFITQFVIVNARVPSASMETTIMTGDRLIANRLSYKFSDPKRYDIVVFNSQMTKMFST